MPLYAFHCHDCERDFEIVESIKRYGPKKVKCPNCRSSNVEHVWSQVHVVTSKKS